LTLIFSFQVIKEGKLIYCRDPDRIADVLENVSRCYAEVYPRYRQALNEIMEEIESYPAVEKEGASVWD